MPLLVSAERQAPKSTNNLPLTRRIKAKQEDLLWKTVHEQSNKQLTKHGLYTSNLSLALDGQLGLDERLSAADAWLP